MITAQTLIPVRETDDKISAMILFVVSFLWDFEFHSADSCRQPQTYVKPEAAITVFELLMMSGVSLETC